MNILFVCRYNRFRSRIAESYFRKINKNSLVKIKSAGIIRGSYPLDKEEVQVAKEFGIRLSGRPKGLTSELLRWQEITIIVANNVPKGVFENRKYGKKTIVWKIRDIGTKESKLEIRKIIPKIIKKVDKLNMSLEKELR